MHADSLLSCHPSTLLHAWTTKLLRFGKLLRALVGTSTMSLIGFSVSIVLYQTFGLVLCSFLFAGHRFFLASANLSDLWRASDGVMRFGMPRESEPSLLCCCCCVLTFLVRSLLVPPLNICGHWSRANQISRRTNVAMPMGSLMVAHPSMFWLCWIARMFC